MMPTYQAIRVMVIVSLLLPLYAQKKCLGLMMGMFRVWGIWLRANALKHREQSHFGAVKLFGLGFTPPIFQWPFPAWRLLHCRLRG